MNKIQIFLLIAIVLSIPVIVKTINDANYNYENDTIPIVVYPKKHTALKTQTCRSEVKPTHIEIKTKAYKLVKYRALTKSECLKYKDSLGLKFCPYDNDHLAGAVLACKNIKNMPSGKDLQKLAQKIYNTPTEETTIYGDRNDKMLKDMGIYVNDSHIYYWAGEEAKDGKGGYVRMFASKGSIPYYAPRDGSGYVSHCLGKVNYGDTKYIITANPEHNSNLAGLPNNDVLLTICYK